MIRKSLLFASLSIALLAVGQPAVAAPSDGGQTLRFDFGTGQAESGARAVSPQTVYTDDRGYGLDPGAQLADSSTDDVLASDKPFFFSMKVPEGAYHLAVTLVGQQQPSVVTVKAETRRLMVHALKIAPGERVTRRFDVHTRTAELKNGQHVVLHDREVGTRTWDDRLTLEFNGEHPAVAAVEITPVGSDETTVFLAGDSTVTDQLVEPWSAWGQMLPVFFKPGVVIANHAESGRTLRSFRAERRWAKLLEEVKPGDFVFIQFAHNDMKEKGQGIGPWQSYTEDLHRYVHQARERGATPILITPMHRRWFEGDKIKNTFGDYPAAMRKVAREENVTLIDLMKMSRKFYEALGRHDSTKAFVHYPAHSFPGQDKAFKDNTHHSPYGAYELARCIVKGIRAQDLPLVSHLRDVPAFDPAHPADPDSFVWPDTPADAPLVKPEGS